MTLRALANRTSVGNRAYKLVSNKGNVNPFPASFLDHRCLIKLYKVTIKENTFVRVQGSFKTEREMVSIMKDTWEQIYRNMVDGVQTHLDQMVRKWHLSNG
jgi:hypothetical protein